MEFLLLLITPLCAAILSAIVRTKRTIIEAVTILAACIEVASFAVLAMRVVQNSSVTYFSLALNGLGVLFGAVVVIVGCVAALYSIGYLREESRRGIIGMHRIRQFYTLFHLFVFSMLAAIVITNPILVWIAIEATTLTTVFLISFYGKPNTVEAAWKFLIINSIALLLGFLGTLLFVGMPIRFGETWALTNKALIDPALLKIAFAFVFVGYGTKTGFAPLHTWLPDAHGMAPVPISSLLSGALLNVSFFALLRFKIVTDTVLGPQFSQQIFLAFGLVSVVVAALLIFTQRNYKRLLAYSSIEHMGVIALGFGAGGAGVFAALLHMLYHAMTKSLLFLSSGNILLRYGTAKISGVRGLGKALPVTLVLFFIGVLSITGVPPFGTFVTEFSILTVLVSSHMGVALVLLAALSLACIGFIKLLSSMMGGAPEGESGQRLENGWTIVPLIALVIVLFFLSIIIPWPLHTVLTQAASLFQ